MFLIECVIKDKGYLSFRYESKVVPRIKETIISGEEVYKVRGVVHYTNNPNQISVLVETIKDK